MVISSTGVVWQNSKAPLRMSAGLIEPRALRGRFEFALAEAGTWSLRISRMWYLSVIPEEAH